ELAAASPGELDCAAFPKLEWVVSLRGKPQAGALSWGQFLARGDVMSDVELTAAGAQLKPSDAINIQYTSGPTGCPKGATRSHRNIPLNGFYAGQSQNLGPADRVCLPVPLYHCFGCVLGSLCCVVHGAAMIFPCEGFQPGATLAAIEQERATAIYGVPTMFIA